jgi:hypothetical protein
MLQIADDGVMYEGLPARWWKTFRLESTPLNDVRQSTVPLFVAHGTRDGTILLLVEVRLPALRAAGIT